MSFSDCIKAEWTRLFTQNSYAWPATIGSSSPIDTFDDAVREAIKWHDVQFIVKDENGKYRLKAKRVLMRGCVAKPVWLKPDICERPYRRPYIRG